MRITIVALGLISMISVFTEALTLRPRKDFSGVAQGNSNVQGLPDESTIQMKKRTPITFTPTLQENGLIAERLTKRGPEPTCQDYIIGIRGVLVSAEKSMEDSATTNTVHAEITSRQPAPSQSILDLLTDLKKQLALARTDIVTAFGEETNPTTTSTAKQVNAIVATARKLGTALEDAKTPLEEENSVPYADLVQAVSNVEFYASSYAEKECTFE
ncbi:hypothetical protein EC991_002514 [Linnemannia zychae]|nr:hypothetical protein EC991_002514 [Linnemannia zychae]